MAETLGEKLHKRAELVRTDGCTMSVGSADWDALATPGPTIFQQLAAAEAAATIARVEALKEAVAVVEALREEAERQRFSGWMIREGALYKVREELSRLISATASPPKPTERA